MQIVSSSEARNNFAAIMEATRNEPVAIQKQGRNAAVLISYEEYKKLTNSPAARFKAVCDDIGEKAKDRGLTEDTLLEILNEDEDEDLNEDRN